jgi:hypothetical protein
MSDEEVAAGRKQMLKTWLQTRLDGAAAVDVSLNELVDVLMDWFRARLHNAPDSADVCEDLGAFNTLELAACALDLGYSVSFERPAEDDGVACFMKLSQEEEAR